MTETRSLSEGSFLAANIATPGSDSLTIFCASIFCASSGPAAFCASLANSLLGTSTRTVTPSLSLTILPSIVKLASGYAVCSKCFSPGMPRRLRATLGDISICTVT